MVQIKQKGVYGAGGRKPITKKIFEREYIGLTNSRVHFKSVRLHVHLLIYLYA